MPDIAWYASFIFLGLSVSVGILVYLLFYVKKKKGSGEQEETTLKELEKKYGKKG
ncbi:MAG: hypothetical protein NT106_06975 [Candidatus Sumerlaeota bacterium]|nr:hypothetical protein [Candidatus Sumerlaeota bacterium]